MSRSRAAASSAAVPSSASSWKTVLIAIVWMPVAAYSSSRPMRSNARATIPAVRASRWWKGSPSSRPPSSTRP
jgi:hypothetical protein